MTTTPKIFGQAKPPAGVTTELYTAPVNKRAQVTIFICNQVSNTENFFIQLRRGQDLPTTYISYNTVLISNGVFAFSSIGLDSGESIWVKSAGGNASFTATGIEFS
jgi:hypothetical protein